MSPYNVTVSLLAGAISPTVQLFEWSWTDVAAECAFLGHKGYKTVQISPPMEHIQGNQWWTRYQPVSYQLQSRSGSESDFVSMIKTCHAEGVGIIADAVINHMAAGSGVGIAGTSYGSRTYAMYSPGDFHHYDNNEQANCQVDDYQDKHNVQYCDLVSLPDLSTGSDYVQETLSSYINKMTSDGIVGVRVDAAKHQDANELAGVLKRIDSSLFVNQEVIAGANEAVTPDMYYGNGHVTEFNYAYKVSNCIKYEGNMKNCKDVTENSGLMPDKYACAFMDNHDTQRGSAPLTYKNGKTYDMANMFMLAWPYGDNIRVMSSYYFSNTDQGPPGVGVNGGANCGNGADWVCEHRRPGMANMVRWRQIAGDSNVENWHEDGDSRISFSRGSAFLALNRMTYNWDTTLQTGLPAGEYCDVIADIDNDNASSSTCTSKVTVNADGTATVSVPAISGLALHSQSKLRRA